MIDDTLILGKNHEKKAEFILEEVGPIKKNDKRVILVSGSSGSGKSETAFYVRQLLFKKNIYSFIISTDDYYVIPPEERDKYRRKHGLDVVGLDEIDWTSLKNNVEDFLNDKPMKVFRENLSARQKEEVIIDTTKLNVLIIEGLFSGYIKTLFSQAYSVFLNGSPEQTLKFREKRQKENEKDEFRKQIVEKEFEIVQELKKISDLQVAFDFL
ncbi:MAG: hypothetical protein ACOCU6_02360 [Nanoarchaeota archaeon]